MTNYQLSRDADGEVWLIANPDGGDPADRFSATCLGPPRVWLYDKVPAPLWDQLAVWIEEALQHARATRQGATTAAATATAAGNGDGDDSGITIPDEIWMLVFADEPSLYVDEKSSDDEPFSYLAFLSEEQAKSAARQLHDHEDLITIPVRVK